MSQKCRDILNMKEQLIIIFNVGALIHEIHCSGIKYNKKYNKNGNKYVNKNR